MTLGSKILYLIELAHFSAPFRALPFVRNKT